eukprot:gene20457-27246_t
MVEHLLDLTNDCLRLVVKALDVHSICACALVCKKLLGLCEEASHEKCDLSLHSMRTFHSRICPREPVVTRPYASCRFSFAQCLMWFIDTLWEQVVEEWMTTASSNLHLPPSPAAQLLSATGTPSYKELYRMMTLAGGCPVGLWWLSPTSLQQNCTRPADQHQTTRPPPPDHQTSTRPADQHPSKPPLTSNNQNPAHEVDTFPHGPLGRSDSSSGTSAVQCGTSSCKAVHPVQSSTSPVQRGAVVCPDRSFIHNLIPPGWVQRHSRKAKMYSLGTAMEWAMGVMTDSNIGSQHKREGAARACSSTRESQENAGGTQKEAWQQRRAGQKDAHGQHHRERQTERGEAAEDGSSTRVAQDASSPAARLSIINRYLMQHCGIQQYSSCQQ